MGELIDLTEDIPNNLNDHSISNPTSSSLMNEDEFPYPPSSFRINNSASMPILYIPVSIQPMNNNPHSPHFRLQKSSSTNSWGQLSANRSSSGSLAISGRSVRDNGQRKLLLLAPRPPTSFSSANTNGNDNNLYLSTMDKKREVLRRKLELRPEPKQLVQRGILLAEGNGQSRISQQQRDLLKRRIAERPSRQKLVTQHILLSAASIDPLIQARCQTLKRNKLADNLNRKLQTRPGPLELVTKKILQVDAELEEALQEGLLPYKPAGEQIQLNLQRERSVHPSIISRSSITTTGSIQVDMDQVDTGEGQMKTLGLSSFQQNSSEEMVNCLDEEPKNIEMSSCKTLVITSSGERQPKNAEETEEMEIVQLETSGCNPPSLKAKMRKRSNLFRNSTPYIPVQKDPEESPKAADKAMTQVKEAILSDPSTSPVSIVNSNVEEEAAGSTTTTEEEALEEDKESNYDRLLKQQEILLQWQDEVTADEPMAENDNQNDETNIDDDYNGITPPCILASTEINLRSGPASNESLEQEASDSSSHEPKPAKCCQCTPENGADNAPSSTTNETNEMMISGIRSRLMEFKVQDLKKECRKRQLAASGTKYQILERLKPFEETVFAEFISRNVTVSSCPSAKTPRAQTTQSSQNKGTKSASGSKKSLFTSPTNPNSTIDMSVIDAVASNLRSINASKGGDSNNHHNMNMGPPIRDVIHDYLQQNQAMEKSGKSLPFPIRPSACCGGHKNSNGSTQRNDTTQQPIIFQLPPNANSNQIVQVMDADGSVLGLTTLPKKQLQQQQQQFEPQPTIRCNCNQRPMEMHQKFVGNPDQHHLRETTEPATQPYAPINENCELQQHQISHHQASNGFDFQQQQQEQHQKFPESTFSFAQMGSGGQFTLAEASAQEANSIRSNQSLGKTKSPARIALPALKQHPPSNACETGKLYSQIPQPDSGFFTPEANQHFHNGCNCRSNQHESQVHQHPNGQANSQNQMVAQNGHHHPHYYNGSHSQDNYNNAAINDQLSGVARRRHSFAAGCDPDEMPANAAGYSTSMEIAESQVQPMPKPLQFDPSDPNSILSAKTLSNHEETLRYQQRKIHELQKELNRSQQHLRQQQQMIWMAKKAQVCCDANGRQQTQAEFWLNQLDVKNYRNGLIQNILEHKSQQQQLQSQISEHKQLVSTEQKLQEELHIDQAVTDIVRLIKQDFRTALLIVQLLRRYQLERTHSPEIDEYQQAVKNGNNTQMSSNQSSRPQSSMQSRTGSIHSNHSASSQCCNHHPNSMAQQHNPNDIVILDDSVEVIRKTARAPAGQTRPRKSVIGSEKSSNQPRSNSISGPRFCFTQQDGDEAIMRQKKAPISKRTSNSSIPQNSSPAHSVDMDEIFRTVLKKASTSNCNLKATNNPSPPTPKTINVAELLSLKSSKKMMGKNSGEDPMEITASGKKTRRRRQPNFASNDSNDSSGQLMPQFNNFHLTTTPTSCSNDSMSNQLACCSDLMSKSFDSRGRSIINSTSLDINCSNKASANEHVCLNSFAASAECKSGATFDYTKNHAFEDLMDVLRDDQEKSLLGLVDTTPSSNDYSLGYTSDELVNFLADDEKTEFCVDSHHNFEGLQSSFENNTNFSGNMDAFSNYNLAYNPAGPNNNFLSSNSNHHHNQHQFHNFHHHSTPSQGYNHHHHQQQDSMDIIPPPSSVDGQHSRDGGLDSSPSVCSANSNMAEATTNSSVARQKAMGNAFNQHNGHPEFFNDPNDQDMEWFDNIDSILEPTAFSNGFSQAVRPMDAFV